jgi:hypothetical protein
MEISECVIVGIVLILYGFTMFVLIESSTLHTIIPNILDSHLVLSECTCLVGTDATSGTECLDGF